MSGYDKTPYWYVDAASSGFLRSEPGSDTRLAMRTARQLIVTHFNASVHSVLACVQSYVLFCRLDRSVLHFVDYLPSLSVLLYCAVHPCSFYCCFAVMPFVVVRTRQIVIALCYDLS